mmetsp:Transcript_35889/g.86387  ORF Transcript_35889/g.86387 Transcript_35889/m.86387 type:complete len:201 (-) Transcript_35889:189-791(-)
MQLSTFFPPFASSIFAATAAESKPVVLMVTRPGISVATNSRRSGLMSQRMIFPASMPFATREQMVPMGPAPNTATVCPGLTRAFCSQAYTPTLNGSHIAPISVVTFSGRANENRAGWATYLCSDPWIGGVAKNRMSGHKLYFPSLHCSQVSQGTPGSRATRSPTLQLVTLAPTSTTSPADSWPITMGPVILKSPISPCCQ